MKQKIYIKAKENLLNNNNILKIEEELELIIQNNQTENLFYLFKNKKMKKHCMKQKKSLTNFQKTY